MKYIYLAILSLGLSSCIMEHDCECTTKSGKTYEQYDVEESCSSLNTEDATCKAL
ncbi:MAG: hypothetical protein MJZ00_00570 [Paludibacteraceae bacterium]|nr:hypothetical protein [Paludibacteraceae bacterium]